MPADPKTTPKKDYRRPVLHDYGNVREVTQTVGMGMVDDGGGMADKTG